MNPIDWIEPAKVVLSAAGLFVAAVKAVPYLYRWLVTTRLRDRSEHASRNADTASSIRSAPVQLRWYEWPAARQLQREEHGAIEGDNYRAWVNVVPASLRLDPRSGAHY